MPNLIDQKSNEKDRPECKKPSRNLLCLLFIEQGADPNIQSS